MNQELEVGQVWRDHTSEREVLKIDILNVYFYYVDLVSGASGVDELSIEAFLHDNTLIKNADGTKHVKPNDYHAGDVWEDEAFAGEQIYVTKRDGVLYYVSEKYNKCFPLLTCDLELTTRPERFKLVYRKGVKG